MEKQKGKVQDIVMRYKYKVRELTHDKRWEQPVTRVDIKLEQIPKVINKSDSDIDTVENVEEKSEMEAMSFKKLKAKLDHKKEYLVMYTNKHGNFISTVVSGKEPK